MTVRDAVALAAYIEDREGWRFGYGRAAREHDCARFAGGGVKAATGYDPLARFTGQWSSRRGAARVISRHGGLAASVGTVMTEIAPTFAQRGDVGITTDGALVLFEGDTVVGVTLHGLRRLDRGQVARAWSAPCPS